MRPLTSLTLATALTLALAGCREDTPPTADAPAAEPAAEAVAAPAAEAPAPAAEAEHSGLMAHEPWTRPLAPGATVAAGYMHLMNHTSQPETLVSARAEGVGRVEIHDMAEVDGVMQMRPVEGGVALAVDGHATFQPGGKHLMFFDVSRSWAEGETVPVTLAFASGQELTVDFAVGARGDKADADHAHHAH